MTSKIQYLVVLGCLLIAACQQPKPEPAEPSPILEARENLQAYLDKEEIQGDFHYEVSESDDGLTAVLRNAAVGRQVNFDTKDSTILLGVYQQGGTVYRSQLVRRDSSIQLQIVNTATDQTQLEEYPFPDLMHESPGPDRGFESLDDCLDHFFCTLEAVQCRANQTCEGQFYGLMCCIEGEDICYSIHFYFPPTKPSCLFRPWPLDPPVLVARW